MRRIYYFAFIFLQIVVFVAGNGFYTIVAPGTIQSNTDFSVAVTLHENPTPISVNVNITGLSYTEAKSVEVSPSETKIINFKVPQIKSALYMLNVNGVKGLEFQNFTELVYKENTPMIYIQSDKATYKPGDLVQYRFIVLDENARPLKLKQPLSVKFKDGNGNTVKSVNGIKLNKGVHSGEFQLSEQPVLGTWLIKVQLGSNDDVVETSKSFEVAKYVLPKFSLEIETNKNIFYEDPIKITIRAKYTHGKGVKGQAIVTLDTGDIAGKSEKVIEVDGKAHVEFDAVKKADPSFFYLPVINVLAVMTEKSTGKNLSQTATIYLHTSRYSINIVDSVSEYHPNVPFEIKAQVKTIEGSPPQNENHEATLTIEETNTDPQSKSHFVFTSALDKQGMAVFKVVLPTVKTYNTVMVTYKDENEYLSSLKGVTETEEDSNIKLVRKTESVQLGTDVVIEVQCTADIPYYVYAIVARGKIIKQEHVKLPANVKSHPIKFSPTFEMVPESYLYVYFVLNGHLKFEEMTLSFPREFQNKIEIDAPKEAKPSEEVSLKVKTDPDSFVGLLGVDQSVLLLKGGNDLDKNKIMQDLDEHKTQTPHIPGYGKYPGKISGLVTLTNAHFPYTRRKIWFYGNRRRPWHRGRYHTLKRVHTDRVEIVGIPIADFEEPQIRKEFVESWIFDGVNNTDANGLATFSKKIPDTITSWVVTGFSLNEKTGFGMVANPTNIKVFQPFFVTTNLPYSVKRGEVISIPIVLFNYMDKALDAEVTMDNTDAEYDFTEVSNEIEELVVQEKQRTKRVSVPSNSGKSISFMIRPNVVGDITLKIKAVSPLAGDAIHKKLKVEPEGVTQYGNEAVFVHPSTKQTLTADIPKEAILDSEYIEFSVVGDILGPTIKNIENLVRKPSGCGEQNMVNFVPNILVLRYLDAIKREMPNVAQRAKTFMEIGYQRELKYKHANGAYSAFGEESSEPNSWLTAYVARSFIQAKKYITIDEAVINDALKYVVSNQLQSGQFNQTGRLFHPSHQNDVGFTAFALLALIEDVEYSNKYKTEIEKAIKYLAANIDKENDVYGLAITMLVLNKAQHSSAGKLKEKLEKLAHEESGLKWWTQPSQDKFVNNDVEVTAYILQAFVSSEATGKLLPIIKWLIGHRNNLGGYDSTQDTVVGLQSLVSFAEKHVKASVGELTIKFEAQDSQGKETTKGSFTVNKENSLTVLTHVLPRASRQVKLDADGEGSSLVYLSYRYNLATKDNKPSFNVKHTILKTGSSNLLKMNVCAQYVPAADSATKESNMAVMEVYLPSGFTADTDKLDDLVQGSKVQLVETKNDDTAIIIYLDYLVAGADVCFEVNAEKNHAVAKQKPSAITIYDYYNSDERATVYYEVKSSLCDICEEGECGSNCTQK